MIKASDVYTAIDKFAPFDTQLGFDNAGLLIGDMNDDVSRIAIALDATADTILAAHSCGCELLVTHHPVIFGGLKNISSVDPAYHALKLGVSVISAHTNLDSANGGVNDCLCDVIGINGVSPLSNGEDNVPLARIGNIDAVPVMSLVSDIKKKLSCGCIKLTASNNIINKVAVCGGAGGDYILAAKSAGVDALVTGECKHHERLLAKQLGISLLECGHFCTEQLIKVKLREILLPVCDNIVIIDECDTATYI